MPETGKTAKLRGLLIKKTDFGEGHSAYTALSSEHGKIDFLTFGSCREKSTRRTCLLVTNLVNAVLARKTEESEWTLREIGVEKSYPAIVASLPRAAFCYLVLEMLDLTVPRGNPFPLFAELPPLMDRLNADPDPGKYALAFLITLLREDGILPDTGSLETDFGQFPGLFPADFRLGSGSKRFILDVLRRPGGDVLNGRTVSGSVTEDLLEFIRHVYRYHSGRDIKSFSLFAGLREN